MAAQPVRGGKIYSLGSGRSPDRLRIDQMLISQDEETALFLSDKRTLQVYAVKANPDGSFDVVRWLSEQRFDVAIADAPPISMANEIGILPSGQIVAQTTDANGNTTPCGAINEAVQWPMDKPFFVLLENDAPSVYEEIIPFSFGARRWTQRTGQLPVGLHNIVALKNVSEVHDDAASLFSPLHIEPLVNQAAALLDRCSAARLAYQTIAKDWARTFLDDGVIDNEIKNIWDQIAQGFFRRSSVSAKWDIKAADEQVKADQAYHDVSASIPYADPNYIKWPDRGYRKMLTEVALAQKSRATELRNIDDEEENTQKKRVDRLENLRVKHRDLRRAALNDSRLLETILIQLLSDFEDAFKRIVMAAEGFYQVLGISLPAPTPNANEADSDRIALDESIRWTRDAGRNLVSLGQKELSFGLSISLRSAIGEGDFTKFVSSLQTHKSATASFPLSPDAIPGIGFIRLRGMSVEIAGTDISIFSGDVRPPKVAVRSFKDANEVKREQTLPTVRLCRITSTDSGRPPEIVLG